MLELKPLDDHNFLHFIALLKERGEAPEDYYRWKYLDQPSHGKSTGFIAYLDNVPVGCIGVVNRTYLNDDEKKYSATWFADWFVLHQVRGNGIGQSLMVQVRKQAQIGYGIPGPQGAQLVAARSGYFKMNNFCDLEMSLNSWRVGYKRFNGSIFKKVFRGLRQILITPTPRSVTLSEQLVWGKPDLDLWETVAKKGRIYSYGFVRDHSFLKWFMDMPLAVQSDRKWWFISSDKMFATGFVETDIWGLKKSKLVDLLPFLITFDESFLIVSSLLKKSAVDLLIAFQNKKTSNFNTTKYPTLSVPLHQSDNRDTSNLFVSLLDKESSWREFNMIPM